MESILDLLTKKGTVYSKLNGSTPDTSYPTEPGTGDEQSLHQIGGPDLTKSTLDLDAKTPDKYQNPETGTTYP
jgi:hypothetical protein